MKQVMLISVLAVVAVASAIGVVYAKHQSRKLFNELQTLQARQVEMDTEWGRLQLEQSAYTTHGRIERLALDELNMQRPDNDRIERVMP